MRLVWFALALLAGCPREIVTIGLDGAGVRDGDALDGGDSPDGDSPGEDGGPNRDAGLPDNGRSPVRFRQMAFPGDHGAYAVFARSRSEVYVGDGRGIVYRFDGQSFTEGWSSPDAFAIRRIAAGPTRLFVATESTLWVHSGGLEPNPKRAPTEVSINALVANSDDEAYVAGDGMNGQTLYEWNGVELVELHQGYETASFSSLYMDANHNLWIGAISGIYSWRDRSFGPEEVEWPRSFSGAVRQRYTFEAAGGSGSRIFLAGSHRTIFELDGGRFVPRWVESPDTIGEVPIRGIAGGEGEAYAVGEGTSDGAILWFDGVDWRPIDLFGDMSLWDIFRLDANTYYAVGSRIGAFEPIVLIGTRQ